MADAAPHHPTKRDRPATEPIRNAIRETTEFLFESNGCGDSHRAFTNSGTSAHLKPPASRQQNANPRSKRKKNNVPDCEM